MYLNYWRDEYDKLEQQYGSAKIEPTDGISIAELDFVSQGTHDSPFLHADYKKQFKQHYNHISKTVIDDKVELYIIRNPKLELQLDLDRAANRISGFAKHFARDRHIRIIVYLTDWEKTIDSGPLTVKNINSGSTGMLDHIHYILIWRCEEICKVLLHELIHCLDLDYYRTDDVHYHESITESLAQIYHIIFTLIEREEPFEKFVHYYGENLKYGIESCARLQSVDWGNTNIEGYFFNRVALQADIEGLTKFWQKRHQKIKIDAAKLNKMIPRVAPTLHKKNIRMYYQDD